MPLDIQPLSKYHCGPSTHTLMATALPDDRDLGTLTQDKNGSAAARRMEDQVRLLNAGREA